MHCKNWISNVMRHVVMLWNLVLVLVAASPEMRKDRNSFNEFGGAIASDFKWDVHRWWPGHSRWSHLRIHDYVSVVWVLHPVKLDSQMPQLQMRFRQFLQFAELMSKLTHYDNLIVKIQVPSQSMNAICSSASALGSQGYSIVTYATICIPNTFLSA